MSETESSYCPLGVRCSVITPLRARDSKNSMVVPNLRAARASGTQGVPSGSKSLFPATFVFMRGPSYLKPGPGFHGVGSKKDASDYGEKMGRKRAAVVVQVGRKRAAVARRLYQWEKDFAAAKRATAPTDPVFEKLVRDAYERYETDSYSLRGWAEIAGFQRWDARNARRAYASWPAFRKCVIKRGGRYFANPAMLMNLQHEFLCRREGRLKPERRGEIARKRVRARRGRFQ